MDILEVARRSGVSTATVSRVLNSSNKVREETAERVRKAMRELQYIPNTSARSLRSGRSNIFGLLVSDIRNPFFPDVIEHFEFLAGQHGVDVTFVNTGYNEERFNNGVRRLLERGVDGIAILTSEVSKAALAQIKDSGTPVVFLNQPGVTNDFQNITVDYVNAFRDAIEHLRMLGHQRIGFVSGPPNLSSAVRRRDAFLSALEQCRLTLDPECMFEGDHKLTGGRYAAERIFSMAKPPTAVICSNDMTAMGLLQVARLQKRDIPEELSLIGFDDLLLTEMVLPALTTLHLSRREIATRSFFALQAMRDRTAAPQMPVILPHLVIRDSTAPFRPSKARK